MSAQSYPHTMSLQEKQDAERQKLDERVKAAEKAEHDRGARELAMTKERARQAFIAAGGSEGEFEGAWGDIRKGMLVQQAVAADEQARQASREQIARMFRS